MVFSATTIESLRSGDPMYYLKRQLIFIFIGFIAMFFAYRIDYRQYRKYSLYFLFISFLLLLLVFIPGIGKKVGGANRWIDLGIISFQPSEIVKIFLIFYLSDALTNKKEKITNFAKGILPVLMVVVFFSLFILKQPDLGTTIELFLNTLLMIYVAGANIFHVLFLFFGLFISGISLSFISPYRWKRIIAFLDPWKDPLGSGFHVIQSLIAIGTGGFFGLGAGGSRQKFLYLPEQYTDFIFSVVCEELGFIGAVVLIVLILWFVSQIVKVAKKAPDLYSKLLCAGFAGYIGIQSFINMAVASVILPTTGIPLPFISYGGTSLVVTMYFVGVILNISSNSNPEQLHEK